MPAATPKGLGDRGRALWASLAQKAGTPAGELALEACRIAERLEAIDEVIKGKGVIELLRFRSMLGGGDGVSEPLRIELSFSQVLAEARQQENVLRQVLVTLGVSTPQAPPQAKGSVDELKARREQGRRATSDASANA